MSKRVRIQGYSKAAVSARADKLAEEGYVDVGLPWYETIQTSDDGFMVDFWYQLMEKKDDE